MNALESRPVIKPSPGALNPFHPETHQSFDNLDVLDLPDDESRVQGKNYTRWIPTGFVIGGDKEFVGGILKERFFHNPAVGYTFRSSDGMVVEYEFQAQAKGEYAS